MPISKSFLLCFGILFLSIFSLYPANRRYADVFKPLDGRWQGKFYVYSHKQGQLPAPSQPKTITPETIKSLPLIEQTVIDVQQVYTSESPYFQRVVITDTYTDSTGTRRVEVSKGVNKVEKGKLLCIMDKPDEQVIHSGGFDGKDTITWERNIRNPLKIEFFKETVSKNRYTIIGWGYYGDDNPRLAPRTWFYAVYQRVRF